MPPHPRVLEALTTAGIAHEVMDCDPDLADTAAFCEAYGVALAESANTILVASRRPPGRVVACVALATTRLDVNGLVRRRMDVRKVSFASPEMTAEITGMEMGGVTVPGLPSSLDVWVDQAVAQTPSVVIGAGTRSAKIRLAGCDLVRLPGVEVVPDIAHPVD